MSRTYAVIAEVRGGKLRQVSLEAVYAAGAAKSQEDAVAAVVIGHEIGGAAEQLARCVDGPVLSFDHPDLQAYRPEAYAAAATAALGELNPAAVFLGHTAIGRDLAPVIAARLGAGQISDVTAVERSGPDVLYTRPLYAGKAFEKKRFVGAGPQVVTIRPNNFPAAEPAEPAATASASASATEDGAGTIKKREYVKPADLRSAVIDVVRKTSGQVDLTEARIVVSGGRGVGSEEGFRPLERLAEVLGGAVGASRGACDAGYCDYSRQIGQTGKVVTPDLYIACGISGAIQHLAGMSQSRVIIAINKDPEAPIFKVADYGIVGDLFEVVPLLTEAFKLNLTESRT